MNESLNEQPIEITDPTDPYARLAQTFPTLNPQQLALIAHFGEVETLAKGTPLFSRGDRSVDFFVVVEGSIEIYETGADDIDHIITVHHPGEFTGELDLFNNRKILVGARMGSDGRVICIKRAQFRKLLTGEPELGEIITRAFILRRVGLITHQQGGVLLLGSKKSGDTLRIQRFLRANGFPARTLSDGDAGFSEAQSTHGLPATDAPVVVYGKNRFLLNPSNYELACALGITEQIDPSRIYDVTVVGAGPSGLAAAVYAASEGLETAVIEANAPGGQAGTSSRIENYLGFPVGISGQALAGRAQVQAQKFGAHICVPRRVEYIDCNTYPYVVELDDGKKFQTRTVVIATGAHYRKLNIESAEKFEGNGVHYAATAIEASVCSNEEVVLVGGGNAAGQAAVYLSRHASCVHMLVRGSELASSMSDYLIGRIMASPRIKLYFETEIIDMTGSRYLERVRWRNNHSGVEEEHAIGHVFLLLGAIPNTEWLSNCIELDSKGFIVCGKSFDDSCLMTRPPYALETSRPHIFAVGDARAGSIKRVASAVGEGSVVVSSIHQVLSTEPDLASLINKDELRPFAEADTHSERVLI